MRNVKILVSVVSLLAAMGPALAADMDDPVLVEASDEYKPVEIGSAWYLRGDIGYNFVKPFDFENEDSYRQKDENFSASIGAGYHINDWLRAELNAGLVWGNEFSREYGTRCGGTETTLTTTQTTTMISQEVATVNPLTGEMSTTTIQVPNTVTSESGSRNANASQPCPGITLGENTAYTGMAKGFVDLGTYSGFTPYVGAGIGLAYTRFRGETNKRVCSDAEWKTGASGSGGPDSSWTSTTQHTFECWGEKDEGKDTYTNAGDISSDKQWGVAWSAGAGVAYAVSENVKLDLGYEYTSLPGSKFVVHENGVNVISKNAGFHNVKLGFRYDLW